MMEEGWKEENYRTTRQWVDCTGFPAEIWGPRNFKNKKKLKM